MKTINYKNFTVRCALEEPVTIDNFWKYDINITQYKNNKFENIMIIPRTFLCMYNVEALLSGNEEEAKRGLDNIIKNMEYNINELKKLCNM